jgi:histidinol-phosphatase
MSDLAFALRLADAADAIAAPHVGRPVEAVSTHGGHPVTATDEAIDRTLAGIVALERPHDGYLGEEVGEVAGGERRWIVDGIDGTAAFVLGRPEWATLIGYETRQGLVVGLATAPALQRRWWASAGNGAWTAPHGAAGPGQATRLAVSVTRELVDARVEVWAPSSQRGQSLGDRLAVVCRCAGDLPWATPRPPGQRPSWNSRHPGGGLLVAAGLLDAFVMVGGGPWDHAATAAIVQEAGGRFTDLAGEHRIDTGHALFSNGHVHEAVLDIVRFDRFAPTA